MTRKFVLLLATLSLLTTLPACTSGDSKGEEEVIAEDGTSEELAGLSEEGGSSENLDESLDGEQTADTTTSPDALTTDTAATATEEQLTIDSFGEGTDTAATGDTLTEPVPEPAAPELEPAPPTTTDVAANDLAPSTGAEEIAPPMTTTPDPAPEQSMSSASTDLDEPKPAPKSLQKVADAPWKVGSKWVNAIYFARPGDSLESISQTIYGDDRTKELKKINPTYKNRDVKPGDKIYYSSVVRPDDSEKIVTFFEEKNVPAKTYVAKPGDNIRKVSQEILGYPEAWKEVWAYNSVESKQEIPEGTELRYWDSSAVASAGGTSGGNDMVNPTSPPPAPDTNNQANNQMPTDPSIPPMDPSIPPPPTDPGMNNVAGNELPPPPPNELPPPPDMGMNNAGNDLPPPPPPPDIPPPPPPMDPAPTANAGVDESGTGMAEEDQTLAMGAVAAAVLGVVALMIVRRKRRQKEMEQALGETHVG